MSCAAGLAGSTQPHQGYPLIKGTAQTYTLWMPLGDCLLFHSHTIHKALPNASGKYLRISADNRYQLASDEVDPGSFRPHYADWFTEREQSLEIGQGPTSSQAAPLLSSDETG